MGWWGFAKREQFTNPTSPLGREWFSEPVFPSSNPLLPLRGGVYPSPYPLPWGGEQVVRREQKVLPQGKTALKPNDK